jgi:hypothetical protein
MYPANGNERAERKHVVSYIHASCSQSRIDRSRLHFPARHSFCDTVFTVS